MPETFTEPELALLRACALFAGMTDEEIPEALALLNARRRRYAKGALIKRIGEPFRYAALVLDGTVTGQFVTEEYNLVILNRFERGGFVGLALALAAQPKNPIQLSATEDCELLLFDMTALPESPEGGVGLKLSRNLVGALVRQNLFLNHRVRILSQGSIRNRLLYYLSECETDEAGFVRVPFSRTELAGFLSVNRSALSREMGNLQREGILELDGPRIRLL